MVPGFGQIKSPKEILKFQEDKLQRWKYAMGSMNKAELENPEIILEGNRIQRSSFSSIVFNNKKRGKTKNENI